MSSESQEVLLGITIEQIQRILSLIKPPKPGSGTLSGSKNWIINTGASHHMTGNLKGLENLEKIDPIVVELPDGMIKIANLQGSISLGMKINLSKVLYVSNFTCNLISVA